MDPTTHIDVHMRRQFNATPDQVFDAWLVPREMGRWMFGAHIHDVRLLRLDVDPRLGGRFSLQLRRCGQVIEHTGHYLALERPHRIAMACTVKGAPDDAVSRLQVDLAPSGVGSVLTLTHRMDARWAADAQQVHDGWNAMLEALGELFA